MSEIIKYSTEGLDDLPVVFDEETVWLTQEQMTVLFEKSKATISEHLKNVFEEEELVREATVRNFRTVQIEGGRQVARTMDYYNLDVVISVGYRVKSKRGTKFRQWATKTLREHLLNGFTLRQPASIEQLNELRYQLGVVIDRLNRTDTFVHEELGKVYETLFDLAEQKRLQENTPRRRIGYLTAAEREAEEQKLKEL